MAAANNEFFEALSMLEHERGITAEYLIEKIKAAIIIAVKKNYEVEEDHVKVDIDPDTGRFDVALIQDVVADEDWYDEHSEIGITEAQKIRKTYEVGDRIITPLKTKDFGRIAAQTAKHVIRQGIREAERNQQLSEIQSRAHDIVQATVTRVDTEKGIGNSIFKSSGNDGSGNGKCNELFCKRDNSCRLCEKRGDDRRTDDRQDYLPQ